MAGEIDQASDSLIASVKVQITKIDELRAKLEKMADDAESLSNFYELSMIKDWVAEIGNKLQEQVEQNTAGTDLVGATQAEGATCSASGN